MARNTKFAKKYAKSLFNAIDIDRMEDVLSQISTVIELMKKNKEMRALLVSPLFSQDDKDQAVDVISDSLNFFDEVRRYLKYIAVNNAVNILEEIVRIAIQLYLDKKKKAVATVTAPVELSEAVEERLRTALKRITDRDVDIEYVKDPSLIGGFVVKIGSTMYDSSLKGQLRLLKDELIKG